jgi:hypothetical protein
MGLIKIPGLQTDKKNQQYFLTILLLDQHVQAALWYVKNNQVEITNFSSAIEYADNDDCLIKTDKALQELGPNSENVGEVIFGFDSSWISSGGLVADKRPLLKKITQELSLNPMGFVVTNEAVFQSLVSQDPSGSAICACVRKNNVELVLVSVGKLAATLVIDKSQDLETDLKEGFIRLANQLGQTDKGLPSKVLFSSPFISQSELKDQQKRLQAVDWPNGSLFPEPPKIEELPPESLIQAVTSQGGGAIAQQRGLINVVVKEGEAPAEPKQQAMSFGVPISTGKVAAAGLESDFRSVGQQAVGGGQLDDEKTENSSEQVSKLASDESSRPKASFLNKVKGIFGMVKPTGLIKNKQGDLSQHKVMITGISIGVISLLAAGYFGLNFLAKALVTINLNNKPVNKEVQIIVDPEVNKSDPENLVLSASLEKKEVTGKESIETTGVKLVGEKAKGKVTLYNTNTELKKFSSGTLLKSGDLEFTLDGDVEVPAAEDEGDSIKKGKIEVDITASEIGDESNLAKDAELQVEKFATSTYSAKVVEGLTGGASREVRVVSPEDQEDLLADLLQSLKKQAKEELEQETKDGRFVIPTGDTKQIYQAFDAEVGDEVDTLSLDLTVSAQAVAYLSEDLRPLAEEVLKTEVPEGYKLTDKEPEVMSSVSSEDSEVEGVVLDVNISSFAVPELNSDDLKIEILGQQKDRAKLILEQKEKIRSAEFKFQPGFASLVVRKLPKQLEKIEVTLVE